MPALQRVELKSKKGKLTYGLIWAILGIGIPVQIFPYVWILLSMFKANKEVRAIPPTFFPSEWHISHTLENNQGLELAVLEYLRHSALIGPDTQIIVEAAVFLTEGLIFRQCVDSEKCGDSYRNPWILSLIVNLVSFATGLLLSLLI